jgi:hypothetical protein
MTFLRRVDVPEICFLQEVPFWVAFRRLPIATYDGDGNEKRSGIDIGRRGFAVELEDIDDWLNDEECASANIPPDPRYAAAFQGITLSMQECDDHIAGVASSNAWVTHHYDRDELVAYKKNMELWLPRYEDAIDYATSTIFLALKDGRLRAKGRLLPEDLVRSLPDESFDVFDFPTVEIPSAFWSLRGIDFKESTAADRHSRYCHIHCRTDDVFSAFPGTYVPVSAGQSGGNFLVNDAASTGPIANVRQPGRPPYPWEPFFLEVATLIHNGQLPAKKEAGIQLLHEWFYNTHGISPSRSSIGEKLKPYYDRFVRTPDRK